MEIEYHKIEINPCENVLLQNINAACLGCFGVVNLYQHTSIRKAFDIKEETPYIIIHLPSGVPLTWRGFKTEAFALDAIRDISTLRDWTDANTSTYSSKEVNENCGPVFNMYGASELHVFTSHADREGAPLNTHAARDCKV